MQAVRCHAWGPPEALRVEEVPAPQVGPGSVRVRIRACGLNFADTLMVAGQYQVKPPIPFIPGIEIAGEVVEVGPGVTTRRVGERVVAYLRAAGGFAGEIVLSDELMVPIPDAMDWNTAAGFPITYGTAHFALTHRGRLRPGETLLVLGAAGGVGLAAVEIGKQLGARVIAAAGSAAKCAVAREHGADEAIDYRAENLRDRIRALTGGAGADVVFDPVGGDAFDSALRAVNWEARMLVVGFASGRVPAVPANLVLVKNVSVIGVVWGAQSERDPAFIAAGLAEMLRWWEAGRLRPRIARTFPLQDATAAMQALLSREHAGKIVLMV